MPGQANPAAMVSGRGLARKDMSRAPWAHDPEFRKLLRKWNGVLARTGLRDIECQPNPTMGGLETETSYLWHWQGETARQVTLGARSGGREFYQMAQEWLDRARWKSLRERMAWLAHSCGVGATPAAKDRGVPPGRMWVIRDDMRKYYAAQVEAEMAADAAAWENEL